MAAGAWRHCGMTSVPAPEGGKSRAATPAATLSVRLSHRPQQVQEELLRRTLASVSVMDEHARTEFPLLRDHLAEAHPTS